MGNLHSHENAKCCKWKCGSFMGSRAKHFTNAHTGDYGVARFIWVEGCPCVPSWSTLHEKSPTLSSARTRKGHCPKFLCHFNAESSAAFLSILLVWLVLWHPDSHLEPVFGVCVALGHEAARAIWLWRENAPVHWVERELFLVPWD